MTRNDIYEAVSRERDRQDRIHGPALEVRDIPRILGEEFGEVCAAINDREHRDRVREELIQCAAVCLKAIENIDRAPVARKYVDFSTDTLVKGGDE